MSLPRRQKVLIGALVLLFLAGVGVYGVRWGAERKHAAHWQGMIDRQAEYARTNGVPSPLDNPSSAQQPIAATEATIMAGPAAVIEPVHLLWKASDWEGQLLSSIDGCLPLDSDRDLVWSGSDLFVLSEPDRIDRVRVDASRGLAVFADAAISPWVRRPVFDGQYVWLTTGGRGVGRIVVVDPVALRGWEFGNEATGLFPENGLEPNVKLAPVRAGVACAFICSNNDSLLAMLHFDPEGKHEVELVELSKMIDLRSNRDLMFTLEGIIDNKRIQRVVIGRETLPALLLDPETNEVTIANRNDSFRTRGAGHWCLDGSSFWWQSKAANDGADTTLMRFTLPDLTQQAVLSGVPAGLMAPCDGGLAFVGRDCWQWKAKGTEIDRLDTDVFWNFADSLPAWMPSQEPPPPLSRAVLPQTIEDLFGEKPPVNVPAFVEPNELFPSNVFGLLLTTNSNADGYRRVYRITTGDAAAEPFKTSRATPPTLTTSRFVLAIPNADAPDGTPLALLESPVEPVHLSWRERLPALARELVRQSFWLAARLELGGAVADGVLGEQAGEMRAGREFRLASSFHMDGSTEVFLESVDAVGSPMNWRQELRLANRDGMLDYPLLMETAEAWSRTEFAKQLAPDVRRLTEGEKRDAWEPGVEVEAALNEMTFPAQFGAVRAASRDTTRGFSDKALGALVRGYANLGLLTEHHWNLAHKTFQARALLYAQRMVVKNPNSATALWHRAYAEAFAGLPGAALDDLAKAETLADSAPPAWVAIIAALCQGDHDALASHDDDPQTGQLSALLRFLQLGWLPPSVAATQAASRVIERQPECFRAYIQIYERCELETISESATAALTALEERLPARLRQLPALPTSIVEKFDGSTDTTSVIERVTGALLDATDKDVSDLSWRALGCLVNETVFAQSWRHAHYMRFQIGENTEEFLAKATSRVARHHCGRLLDFYANDFQSNQYLGPMKLDDRRKAAAAELLKRVDLADLTELQQQLYDYFFGQAWQVQQPEQYIAALSRCTEHRDGVMRDLLRSVDREPSLSALPDFRFVGGQFDPDTARQLNALNPGNPDAVATALGHSNLGEELCQAVLEKYPKHPRVLLALTSRLGASTASGQQALNAYIKFSPDAWAYQAMARSYLTANNLDEWQALQDDYLSRRPNSAQAAQVRVEVANFFLARGEFEKALPYAAAAAETKGEAAIGCLIHCYQGLGEDGEEGVWHAKMVDLHPSGANVRERYLWSRRTGLGDAKALAEDAAMRIGGANAFAPRFFQGQMRQGSSQRQNELASYQARNGTFFWLAGRRDEALEFYQAAAELTGDLGHAGFYHSCCALIAEEKGDQAVRDTELARVSALRGSETDDYRRLASLLAQGFAKKKIDPEEAEKLAAAAPAEHWGAMNFLLGYSMLLVGQTREAVIPLTASSTFRQGAGSMSRTLSSAALRDRGLIPGKINQGAESILPEE